MSYHIIGDRDTILGFRFAGITGDAVETPEQAQEAFRRAISSHEPGILLLTEEVEDMLSDEVTAHRLSVQPPFVAVVKSLNATVRKPRKSLQSLIGEAVGIKLVDNSK